MSRTEVTLTDKIVDRRPLGSTGASGNTLELVTLQDGRRLVLKRVSPEWDWLSRATGDDGRICVMWEAGLFQRIPEVIEHTVVGVDRDGTAWNVFMRDVSGSLVPPERRLDRTEVRQVLAACAELHATFWEEPLPELCGLEDRYRLLSPATADRERRLGTPSGELIVETWELFAEHAPADVVEVVRLLADRPRLLAEQLASRELTLVHGDVRLSNLGLLGDRVVLVDWGERTGAAPAAVDLASFLIFDALRFDVPREQVIADYRELYRDRWDERAFQLSMLGGLVQLAPHFGLGVLTAADDAARAAALADLDWWVDAARTALETWSPR